MGELIAMVLNDYIAHVAKDCKYEKDLMISWNKECSSYRVYFTQPNAGTNIYFPSSAEESLIKMCMIVVSVMKTFKESRRKEMAEKKNNG